MTISRKQFGALLGALGVGAWGAGSSLVSDDDITTPNTVPTGTGVSGRVVVVGGGMAGASAAKFLRLWGGDRLQVTLVDAGTAYTSNIMSNLVLTGQRTISSLQYTWSRLRSAYGITVVNRRVTSIDATGRRVRLADGTSLPYDRLVVAPGVVFDAIPGLTQDDYATRFPHAWQAGPQTTLLRQRLLAMPAGGTFVMTIPAAPYRCPPGPYERACVVADWLKKNKPGSKVVVLDANPGIVAEPRAFTQGFTQIHSGVVTYVPGAVIDHIDAATQTVHTSKGAFRANVLNPIPPHRAGTIAQQSGLVNVSGRWAGVDVRTYESTAVPRVHVLGDAIGTTQPKSGHAGNAEAKVAAAAIANLLAGRAVDAAPATSSACYSPITMSTASWLTAVFQYDAATRTMRTASIGEAPSITSRNFSQMSKWFSGLMADTFA